MDEKFYYLLLAIPATCLFWFLYLFVLTELANWFARRRSQARKSEAAQGSSVPVESPRQETKRAAAIRGFDSPDLYRADMLIRIRKLEKQIADREGVEN